MDLQICRTIKETRDIIKYIKRKNKTIGFVPTMGALHKGHLSLINQSKIDTDFTVVSIYVNPIQFGPNEDFKQYPRNLKNDIKLCKQVGADLLFLPSDSEMYPQTKEQSVSVNDYYIETYVDQLKLSKVLCGRFRKNHFRGVMTVVTKLFNIVKPDIAYFGAKDYQQAKIIEKMVADLNFDIQIKIMPTIRENDGLAMSSRNKYLTRKERKEAPYIYKTLLEAKERILKRKLTSTKYIKKFIREQLTRFITSLRKIDYIEIIDPDNLQSLEKVHKNCIIVIALHTRNARLIDNIMVSK